jgi:nicotinate dehydrogenase subunit B
MNKILNPQFSRRRIIQGAGLLVVSTGMPIELRAATAAMSGKPALAPDQLDSFIAIAKDGSVTAYFGKIDGGQGLDVAIGQIVADELDVPVTRVKVVMGDTATSLNQGGASNASGIEQGSAPLRHAAAEARRLLVDMAAQHLKTGADQLSVSDGIVSVTGDTKRRVGYGELIGGRYFNAHLEWNKKYGNDLDVQGQATPKNPSQYKVIGTSPLRNDIAAKVFAKFDYVTDIRVPGMLHARVIRPPVAGSVPTAVDQASIKAIPGAKVVWKQGFLAVVAPKEWNAIRAKDALKVTWSQVQPPFPEAAALYDHIRNAPATKSGVQVNVGAADTVIPASPKIVEAEYEWPFQSHASMGPACAIADVKKDSCTVWTGSQKPHYARDGVAALLKLDPGQVRAIWVAGPGSYGRNDGGDAVIDAAILSQELGRPVRVQYMRADGHAWDPKSPASVHKLRAGIDATGKVVAFQFKTRSFSRFDVATSEADPRDALSTQLMGGPTHSVPYYYNPGEYAPGDAYNFENKQVAWDVIPPLLDGGSPLRTSHMRDPLGPELTFAGESFIDELANATKTDPIEFRLRYMTADGDIAVVKAAAERAQWETRPSGPRDTAGDIAIGRGIGFAHRGKTIAAVIANVEVTRSTGQIRVKRLTVAHDCGLIVNPGALKICVEHQVVYASSRALHEQVAFDKEKVTSVDWLTYPILDVTEAPDSVEIVLLNRPDQPPTGAGEPSTRPVAAAIANAVFDATGTRIRRGPLLPERLKRSSA